MPEAIVALGEAKRVVGRLYFESDGRRQHSRFEYDREWLEAGDRFQLAPGLPLRGGGFFAAGRGDRRNALNACFRDAAPDSWGRALMTRALGGGLTEFDYLTLSDDRMRHGALRFLDDGLEPLSRLSPPVPRRQRSVAAVPEDADGGADPYRRGVHIGNPPCRGRSGTPGSGPAATTGAGSVAPAGLPHLARGPDRLRRRDAGPRDAAAVPAWFGRGSGPPSPIRRSRRRRGSSLRTRP